MASKPKAAVGHKRPRAEEGGMSASAKRSAGEAGFASAMGKIMARDLSGKATPVLAKRKTTQQKQADKAAVAVKEDAKKNKAKKKLRKAHLVAPDPLQADFERQLRKVSTKGVVALFNAIAKHQRSIDVVMEDTSKPAAKAAVVATQNKSFLDLLKGSVKPAPAAAGAAKPGWSVLTDNFVHKAGGASGGGAGKPQAKRKAVREQEEEEEDGGWLGEDDGGY